MDHKISKLLGKPTLEGQVGESHVWDGPLNTSGFPKEMGNSRGITGMKLKHAGIPYKSINAVLAAQGRED
jgi:hypothetical protein